MTDAREPVSLPRRILLVLERHFPDRASDPTLHAAIAASLLPRFDPVLRIAEYDELLRLEIAQLEGQRPLNLIEEAQQLAMAVFQVRNSADELLDHTHQFITDLQSRVASAAVAIDSSQIPIKLLIFVFDNTSNPHSRDSTTYWQNVSNYLTPHLIPDLLDERFFPYVQFMKLRIQMYLEKRAAHLVLSDAQTLSLVTRERLDNSVPASVDQRRCEIVIDKLDAFIAELEGHLKRPRGESRG